MCKHAAAVLYGVGNRLDSQPELLFLLRGVEAQELITTAMTLPDTTAASDSLADDQLGAIFGIDLDIEGDTSPAPSDQSPAHTRARIAATRTRQTTASQAAPRVTQHTKTPQAVPPAPRRHTVPQPPTRRAAQPTRPGPRRTVPPQSAVLPATAKTATEPLPAFHPTGTLVARLRRQQGLSVAQFAAQLGVSEATVYRWEATKGPLTLQARTLPALAALQQQVKHSKRGERPSRTSKGPPKV
jgi:DNA-binding transcriptional regulator YiaG